MAIISPDASPLRSILAIFTAWKTFLIAIALGAGIAPDYDTSTSLFFERVWGRDAASAPPVLAQLLTRWDALYFMHVARDDYVYEQEWAFGAGIPILVKLLSRASRAIGLGDNEGAILEPLVAIGVSHAAHLASAAILYKLTVLVSGNRRLAFVSSVLHIICPAGLFLSAPYAESTFSFLSFAGNWLFALGLQHSRTTWRRNSNVLAAGLLFGLSTLFRSNGLSSGLMFAVESINSLLLFKEQPGLLSLLTVVAPIVGGISVAAGSVVPQYVAWQRYCGGSQGEAMPRPWCQKMLPSIYSFVQAHYWDVGFLKYWTLNQVPLFLLAAPVLSILITSGFAALKDPSKCFGAAVSARKEFATFSRTLAAIQTTVAVLALTNYHVQIISRLASGYMVWYWWIGSHMLSGKSSTVNNVIPMFMVMYATIQGGLFASFLPPA